LFPLECLNTFSVLAPKVGIVYNILALARLKLQEELQLIKLRKKGKITVLQMEVWLYILALSNNNTLGRPMRGET